MVNLSRIEYCVNVWGPEGGLQENDKINDMSFKEIIKVHGIVDSNNAK
jgi:hypothetical protein